MAIAGFFLASTFSGANITNSGKLLQFLLMQALKDQIYNPSFFKQLSKNLHGVYPAINQKKFYAACVIDLDKLELKQRTTRTTDVCKAFFPDNYKDALNILYAYSETIDGNSFADIFMPDYVARFGIQDFRRSMKALRDFTRYSTSELAIRVFLDNDYARTMETIKKWTDDKDFHVRRLSSEGTRPRLPWAQQVNELLRSPDNNFSILDALKYDDEKYVQKSVANHINDISKDHPDKLMDFLTDWDTSNDTVNWIVKHGTRTLIKQGNKRAFKKLGVATRPKIKLSRFTLDKSSIALGDKLGIEFKLDSTSKTDQLLVVDYKIHYQKASGKTSAKVFKLKTFQLAPGNSVNLQKKHLFKNFTTRKHYSGKHQVEIIVNGKSQKTLPFMLTAT